jgi:hypothetical protein
LLFSFTLLSSGFSKILNIENKIQIEVPASHKFIKYDNEEVKNNIEEIVQDYDGMEIDLYLVGPKKYVDLEKAILDGEDPMDNEYVRSIMNKLERKNFKDEVRAGKWMVSEAKKIMKKEKIDFITYALVSNQSWIKISAEEGGDLGDMINDLQTMDNRELNEATKEIRKEITKLSGNNKSILVNESMTINLSKFDIAKNENDELFLKSNGKLIMIFGAIKLDVMLNVFIAEHKSKTYAFISACYVDCSKFNSKFNNMIKPVFSTIKKTVKTKTTNSSNNDLIEQLEQLNSLFKSGVLTKEEFEKAKKKILN